MSKNYDPPIICRAPRASESAHSVSLRYLAEGAANVVFRIQPNTDADSMTIVPIVLLDATRRKLKDSRAYLPCISDRFVGKVLRLCKGFPNTLPGRQLQVFFDRMLAPLFRGFEEHLIGFEAVQMASNVLFDLSAQIWFNSRRRKRMLPNPSVGLLMDDYSSVPGSSVTIEIKPKWLAQSPNAPGNAYRCRTCAMQALRRHSKSGAAEAFICPLQLLAGNVSAIREFLLAKFAHEVDPVHSPVRAAVVDAMTEYLAKGQGHRLLTHLRDLQTWHDHSGVLARPRRRGEEDAALQVAMTLRDCSLFVKVTYSAETPRVECKIADLDFKHEGKIGDWRKKEEQLLNGGWYTYNVGQGQMDVQEKCVVAKRFRRSVPYCW